MAKKAVKKSIARKAHKVIKEKVKKAKKAKVEEASVVVPVDVSASVASADPESLPEVVPTVVVSSEPEVKLPVYDGVQITAVLDSGHTKTHFKCAGKDRNGNRLELHVPRELF